VVVPDRPVLAAGLKPVATGDASLSGPKLGLAVQAGPDGANLRVLQGPSAGVGTKLGLELVDYDQQGAIRFAGTAPAGSVMRLYIDNAAVGDATADASGHWRLSPEGAVPVGLHRLRLDQVGAGGAVMARAAFAILRYSTPIAARSGIRT
jgi:hypothetical protein